jgi:ascorbate-specific PTS system EIIC-type component UlaA
MNFNRSVFKCIVAFAVTTPIYDTLPYNKLTVIVIIVIIICIYSAIMQTLQRRWTDRCVCGVTDRLSHEQATSTRYA